MQPPEQSPLNPRATAHVSLLPRSWFSFFLGALVSAFALWLIARTVNFNQMWEALTASHVPFFIAAFFAQLVATLLGLKRWQILLLPYLTRFWNLTQIFFIAHLLNTLLPAKLGTVARVALAAESEKLNGGFVLGSVAFEKVLDTLVMLLLLLALAPFVPLPAWVRDSLIVSVLFVIGALLVLASARRVREPLLNWIARVETRLLGQESQRVSAFTQGILESIGNLTRRREAVSVLFWTVCMWLTGALVNQLLFAALDLNVSWSATWFVMVALQLGTRIPALPANLGVFHYVVILALAVYGVNENAALAFAILLHLVVFILPAFIGAACALPVSARLMAWVANGLRWTI